MKKVEINKEEARLVEVEEQALDQVSGGVEDEDEIEIDG